MRSKQISLLSIIKNLKVKEMFQINLFLIVMSVFKGVLMFSLVRNWILNASKTVEPVRRKQSKVRSRFATVQEVQKFQEWREYVRKALIDIEAENILKDKSDKIYHSL